MKEKNKIEQEKKKKRIKSNVPKRQKVSKKKKIEAAAETPKASTPTERSYLFAVGRRKEAIARVRYYSEDGKGEIAINKKPLETFFPHPSLRAIVRMPLELVHLSEGHFSIKTHGGGIRGQAESIRLGISRILVKFRPELRGELKRSGFLTRDARVKERKKYGLKRARRAPQWQKR